MSTAHEDNVHPIRPGVYDDFIVDHDEDGDGVSDSTDLVAYAPLVPAVHQAPLSIIDVKVLPPKSEIAVWLDECRGGIELRWHVAKVHTVRSPVYFFRAARHSLRGAWKALVFWWAWVRDWDLLEELADIRFDNSIDAARRGDKAEAKREERKRRVRLRWAVTVVALIAVPLLYRYALSHYLLVAIAVTITSITVLGLIGAQRHAIVPYEPTPVVYAVTTDLVLEAFIDATITKAERPVAVCPPGPLRQGTGYFVQVVLPGGMTFDDDVKPKARRLASGLHVARARLDFDLMEDDDEAAFGIYVSDVHPSKMPVPTWPLLTATSWDIWQPVPVGPNLRGELEMLNVIFTSVLVGAAPRMGKTWTIRLPFLAGALDPRVQQDIFDFKGGGDWSMWNGIAGLLVEGPSDESVEAFRDYLRDDLWPDVQRRSETLKNLGTSRAPGAKVTPALSADPTLGLHIRMLMADECHIATEHPEYGEEICDLLRKVTAQAPAGGTIVALATQKPDAKSVPSVVAANMNTRIAGRCLTYQASASILGTAAKQQGWEAETIGRTQKGTVIMLGAGDDAGASNDGAQIRACEVDGVMAEEICLRAKRLRTQAAITVGPAAVKPAEPSAVPVPQIVADVLRVWPKGDVVAHLHDLAEALGRTRAEVSGPLRKLGLAPHQNLKIRGVNRSGYDLLDVQKLAGSDPL